MSEIETIAEALTAVEFSLPGAGGLRGSLRLAPAQARAMAEAAVKAMPRAQKDALLMLLPKYQQHYIAGRTRLGPSSVALLIGLVRKGIEVEQRGLGQSAPNKE